MLAQLKQKKPLAQKRPMNLAAKPQKVEEDIRLDGFGFPSTGIYPYDVKSFGAAPVAVASGAMGVSAGAYLDDREFVHGNNLGLTGGSHFVDYEGPYDTDAFGLFPGINLAGASTPAWGYAKMAEHAKNTAWEMAG